MSCGCLTTWREGATLNSVPGKCSGRGCDRSDALQERVPLFTVLQRGLRFLAPGAVFFSIILAAWKFLPTGKDHCVAVWHIVSNVFQIWIPLLLREIEILKCTNVWAPTSDKHLGISLLVTFMWIWLNYWLVLIPELLIHFISSELSRIVNHLTELNVRVSHSVILCM